MQATPIQHWPGRMVELKELTVHVRSTPEGPAEQAVFVHGLAGSATNWTDLMGELSDVVTGHALDLPGAGYSPAPPDDDYSVDAHARAVIGLIEKLGGPVHLFGNSLGGAVSVRVAATRPELVRTLTLISPALPDLPLRYGPMRVALSATPGLGEWAMARLLRSLPPERRVRATLSMCYADCSRVHPQRLEDAIAELVRRDELPHAALSLVRSARGLVVEYLMDYLRRGESTLWRQAARVQAPTLVIHGRHDRLVNPRAGTRACRTFPDVRVITLPHAGHVAQMEYPELVAREARLLITAHPVGNAKRAG